MDNIKLCHVTKSFGSQRVLDRIDLELESSKIYGIVGRNASGKTVLLKCILGFLNPDDGEILINGSPRNKSTQFLANAGFLINSPGFLPEMSGYKNLKYLASIRQKANNMDIRDAMTFVGLDPTSKKRVAAYSLGMRQKLAIAQAIMEKPDILIMDEPMNALDDKSVDKIRGLLQKLRQEGKLIVLTSHNREDIDLLCDEVYRMGNGQLSKI